MATDEEFIEYENKQLSDLQKTFTPAQQKQYGEEVEYIKYLLDLLKKEQNKPQTKKQKEEEKKTKDKIKKNLSQLVNNYTLSKATAITHTELTPEEMLDAKLTKVSNRYYRLGGIDSDNYIVQEGISPDWKLDNELSNEYGIVAFNEKTGKAKLAFRGTDRGNLGDLEADAKIYFGTEQNHPHFKEGREQARKMIEKYGKENSSITGYSLGGNKSWSIANEFGVSSTGFNSFIGKNIVNRPDTYTEGVSHTIIRTQDDLPSIQTAYLEGKNNTQVKVVETRGGNANALNPFKAHADTNFISNEGRSSNKNNKGALDQKLSDLAQHSVKHGELRVLNEMIKHNKGEGTPQNLDPLLQGQRQQSEAVPLINRNEPKIRFSDFEDRDNTFERSALEPYSVYQDNLDTQAEQLVEVHAPKLPIPKNVKSELGNNLPSHNNEGLPIEDRPINIRKQIRALEKSRPYLTDRSSKGGYKFAPEIDTLGNETRALEKKLGLDKPQFRPDPTSTTPQLDIELNDIEEFARGLSPIRKRTITKTKSLPAKTKAEIKGLRNKTNPPLERPNNKSRSLEQQTKRLENQLVPDLQQSSIKQNTFTEWVNNNMVNPSNNKKSLWELSGGKLTDEEKKGYKPNEELNNSLNDLNDFVNKDIQSRQDILSEHSQTQNNMETEINSLDNIGIRSGGKSYAMEIGRGVHPQNLILGYLTGASADAIMNKYVDKIIPDQPEPLRTAETGAIAGGLTSTILGTALLPEAVAGGAGYLTQEYATKGIYAGLKKLGASENVSEGTAQTLGGATAGGVAGALGSILAGATAGGEEGAIAGMGFGSAELGAIGAGIGGLIGLGSYLYGRFK